MYEQLVNNALKQIYWTVRVLTFTNKKWAELESGKLNYEGSKVIDPETLFKICRVWYQMKGNLISSMDSDIHLLNKLILPEKGYDRMWLVFIIDGNVIAGNYLLPCILWLILWYYTYLCSLSLESIATWPLPWLQLPINVCNELLGSSSSPRGRSLSSMLSDLKKDIMEQMMSLLLQSVIIHQPVATILSIGHIHVQPLSMGTIITVPCIQNDTPFRKQNLHMYLLLY